jgi:hypothetical protein
MSAARARVLFCLALGVQHQHVPRAIRAAFAARILRRVHREQIVLALDFLLAALDAALFGFKNEAILLVKIDPPERIAIVLVPGDDALKHVIVALMGGTGGLWMLDTEEIAEFGQEQRVIRALLPTLLPLPADNERLDAVMFFGVSPHGCNLARSHP